VLEDTTAIASFDVEEGVDLARAAKDKADEATSACR
jgi:hypothetical protein